VQAGGGVGRFARNELLGDLPLNWMLWERCLATAFKARQSRSIPTSNLSTVRATPNA
jgi:hypothetical protein